MADEVPNLPPGASVQKSSRLSEATFLLVAAAVVAITFTLIRALEHLNDPKSLGIMLWIMGGAIVLVIGALASPWIGTIKFNAGPTGVTGEIDGGADHKS